MKTHTLLLAGVAALLMATSAHAVDLPDKFNGRWCRDEDNSTKEIQIYFREEDTNLEGPDRTISCSEDGKEIRRDGAGYSTIWEAECKSRV
jgi:hypothetical protein